MSSEPQTPSASSSEINTDYQIGQDNIQPSIGPLKVDIHDPVFGMTAGSVIALVLFCLIFDEIAADAFGALRPWLTTQFDWVFAISMNIFVIFCLYLVAAVRTRAGTQPTTHCRCIPRRPAR